MAEIKHIKDLTFDPKNARRRTERSYRMIQDSIRDVGMARSIVIDEDGVILAGNGTVEGAIQVGIDRVRIIDADGDEIIAVRRSGLTPEQKQRLALYDNRTADLAEWDPEMLARLQIEGVELDAFWSEEELQGLMDQAAGMGGGDQEEAPEPEIDRAEELREKWCVEYGQLWQIGRHRLLCGDSTKRGDVERLMDGEKAEVLWTDPPYGVSYVGKTKDALTIENDGADGLPALLADAFAVANEFMAPNARFYIASPPGTIATDFRIAIRGVGWKLHQALVWVKNSMVLGHSDYHYKHEDILYGYKPGPGRPGRGNHEGTRWYGDHSQTSVLEFNKPNRNAEHPTMKPPELVAYCLSNSAKRGDVILDLFSGSGSTIVACEQRELRGYGSELDPRYVAVTLERLSQMGLTPELIESA